MATPTLGLQAWGAGPGHEISPCRMAGMVAAPLGSLAMRISVGHSPDPDDAFMFYGMLHGKVDARGFEIDEVVADIEALNLRALAGDISVTAVSFHTLASVADAYAVLDPGASMGLGYGPVLVAKGEVPFPDLDGRRVALPGPHTTATLLMRMYAEGFEESMVPFDKIMGAVEQGEVDAGLLIHEGQVTYEAEGFKKVADFGEIWAEETTGLPLPLGTNVVNKALGPDVAARFARVLLDSISWANANREETNAYAIGFGRGLAPELNDRFVRMYVNDCTLSLGEKGVEAVNRLFERAAAAGALPEAPAWDLVLPAH